MTFKPTHLTLDGMPVRAVNLDHPDGALVQTRTGARHIFKHAELRLLGGAEAQDMLTETYGADEHAAAANDTADRETLARWALAVDESRQILADGVADALRMGVDHGVRQHLGAALKGSLDALATFRP